MDLPQYTFFPARPIGEVCWQALPVGLSILYIVTPAAHLSAEEVTHASFGGIIRLGLFAGISPRPLSTKQQLLIIIGFWCRVATADGR